MCSSTEGKLVFAEGFVWDYDYERNKTCILFSRVEGIHLAFHPSGTVP